MARPRKSITPADAATDTRLVGCDLRVLVLLGRHVDREGWCRRRQGVMADELGLDRRTVIRSLNRLEKLGYVERQARQRTDGGRASNQYRLLSPERQGELELAVTDVPEPTPPVTPVTHTPVTPVSQAPVTPGSHTPCDSWESHPMNDPFKNDSSLREVKGPAPPGSPANKIGKRKAGVAGQRELLPAVDAAMVRPVARPPPQVPLTPDWSPNEIDRAYAGQQGLSSADTDRQAERFRDYWLGRGALRADWSAMWRTWIRRALENPPLEPRRTDHDPPSDSRRRTGTEAERLGRSFAALVASKVPPG